MKQLVYAEIIGALVFCFSPLIACAQRDGKTLLKEETEAESLRISRME